jgi:serine/threonine protein kinase
MGEVYRARDTRLDRTVAIKILPAHLSSSAELKARFEREARAVSALNHVHICHLYDIGSQDDTSYLIMEYLDGESLADRLRKGALPIKQTLQIGLQIAEALTAAHRAGILHRDLKPANVMLTAGGAKLLDFGLAKSCATVVASAGAAVSGLSPSTPTIAIAELSSPAKALTQQGTVIGTFQYIAPEVLQGAEADARGDIFSLGCVLYEMATGRRAFEGKSQLSVLTGILEKDPEPVSRVQPASPAVLDHVVKTCLEKNPDERFQTAHDVGVQLKWIAEGGAQTEVGPSAQRHPRLGWLVAGAALLVALASIAYVSFSSRPAPVVQASILPPPGTSFATMTPRSGPPVLSPDGTRLAFTARDDKGKILLYVRTLTSLTAQPLAGTDDAMYPFWSPDNRQIGFFVPGKVMKIDSNGGAPQTVCEAGPSGGRGGAWSKQGVIVFNPQAVQPLLRVSESGGVPEPASKLQGSENSHRWPQFLPDGKHFLYWSLGLGGPQDHTLYVGLLGSLQAKAILKGTTMATYASGYLLFMRDTKLLAQPFDLRRLEVTGEAVTLAEGITLNELSARPVFSVSENGVLVYQSSAAPAVWNLLWLTRDGKQVGSIAQEGAPYFYPSLSPEGTRVVATFASTLGMNGVWIFDLQRGTRTRITFENGIQHHPLWAPDGRTIFYGSLIGGVSHIYAKAADGTGSERTILASGDASESPTSISPDGRYLVYDRRPLAGARDALWILPLFGDGKPFPIVQTSFDAFNAAVAPDGKWMAYQTNESGRHEIYITPFPGGGAKWQVSSNGGVSPSWRRDSKELFFLDSTNHIVAVDMDTSGSAVRLGVPHSLFLATDARRGSGPFDVTADGKKFLVNSGDVKESGEPMTLVLNWTTELKK